MKKNNGLSFFIPKKEMGLDAILINTGISAGFPSPAGDYKQERISLDKELINRYCRDADIVHHLAGITDVPRVKSESNDKHDEKIKRIAEEGTQNILDTISDDCKIIMPSTHVVFEGLEDIKKDIKENEETKPILSYGKSKDINEKQKEFILKHFDGDGRLNFSTILSKLDTRMKIVVTFLAILDMVREGLCSLQQNEIFGELELQKTATA